jgi:hypothetical protein
MKFKDLKIGQQFILIQQPMLILTKTLDNFASAGGIQYQCYDEEEVMTLGNITLFGPFKSRKIALEWLQQSNQTAPLVLEEKWKDHFFWVQQ